MVENYIQIPKYGKFWILFDIDNGHRGGKGYIWIFKTKKEANIHKREQYKLKNHSRLSKPIKAVL